MEQLILSAITWDMQDQEMWMWHLGMCFNGGFGTAGVMVGLSDLEGGFSILNDSMILRNLA